MTVKEATRLSELDAMRGWAALSVVVFHVFWEILGLIEPVFRNLATAPFINGGADVAIFFVLSGDVLVYNFLATGNITKIQDLVLKRYLRLTLPVCAASVIVWVMMHLGLSHWTEASVLVHREDWFRFPSVDELSFRSLLEYITWGVYSLNPALQYITFLWTIRVELFGSAAVILYALVQQRILYKKTVIAGLAVVLFVCSSYFAAFFIGVLIAQCRVERLLAPTSKLKFAASIGLLGAGLLLSLWAMSGDHFTPRSNTLVGAVVVAGIVLNQPLCAFLARNRLSQFLGHVSFPLYLIQYAVIIGPMSWVIIWAHRHGLNSTIDHVCIAVGSVLFCILCAWIFSPVERGTAIINRFVVAVAAGRIHNRAHVDRVL